MTRIGKLAAIAILATGSACNAEGTVANAESATPAEAIEAPDGSDWSQTVAMTDAGGYLMGNPDAPVKLIEYGSFTCPHCANFELNGADDLVEKYVKTGRVSWEYRNYIFNAVDMTAALVARCMPVDQYFPMQRSLFERQREWGSKGFDYMRGTPGLEGKTPQEVFAAIADASGLKTMALARGLSAEQVDACVTDTSAPDRLLAMTQGASQDYGATGTPAMIVNGQLHANVGERWSVLEPILQEALAD